MSAKISSSYRKWHRRVGVTAAFFVLILAITGAVLLFAGTLGLDRVKWSGPVIAKIYHQSPASKPVGIALTDERWIVWMDGLVYIGAQDPLVLSPPLLRAGTKDGLVHISNGRETLIALPDGTLVERLAGMKFDGNAPSSLPKAITQETSKRFTGRGMPASRVLLDIHTGRVLGPVGPWLMALASLFLIFLSVSGVILWIRKKLRPGSPQNRITDPSGRTSKT